MIEDKATERWKERTKKLGLIVNAGADQPQPKPKTSTKKAIARWEGEGGTVIPKKRGSKK